MLVTLASARDVFCPTFFVPQLFQFAQWCGEYTARRREQDLAAVRRVQTLLLMTLPGTHVELFGSFITGLAVPDSDVDILVQSDIGAWVGGVWAGTELACTVCA